MDPSTDREREREKLFAPLRNQFLGGRKKSNGKSSSMLYNKKEDDIKRAIVFAFRFKPWFKPNFQISRA